jgi:hypothetical protein
MRTHSSITNVALTALGAALLTLPASARQSSHIRPALLEGDPIASAGIAEKVDDFQVLPDGSWRARVQTADALVLISDAGGVVLRDRTSLPNPMGARILGFRQLDFGMAGRSALRMQFSGGEGLFLDDQLVRALGDRFLGSGLGFKASWDGFDQVALNGDEILAVSGRLQDAASGTIPVLALVKSDANGVAEQLVHRAGATAPDTGFKFAGFASGEGSLDLNDAGDLLFTAEIHGPKAMSQVIYLNDRLLARTGTPSPVAKRDWYNFAGSCVSLAANGGFAFHGRLTGERTTNGLIVVNGKKFVQEGDKLGAIPTQLSGIGSGGPYLSDGGDVLWYGEWDGGASQGLFLNRELVVEVGATEIEGFTVASLSGGPGAFCMSDDGRYVAFVAKRKGAPTGWFLLDRGPWRDLRGAVAAPSGVAPRLTGHGTLEPGSKLELAVSDAAPDALAILVVGSSRADWRFHDVRILPAPDKMIPLAIAKDGTASYRTVFSSKATAGLQIFAQCVVIETKARGTKTLSASNAVVGTAR